MNINHILEQYKQLQVDTNSIQTSRWQDLVDMYTELANQNCGRYRKWTHAEVAKKIAPIYHVEGANYLEFDFYKKCQSMTNPSAFFRWSVNPKNSN